MIANQVVKMISMFNSQVTAVRSMKVVLQVTSAVMVRGAFTGVALTDRQGMFFIFSVFTVVMQVTVMEVINMVFMVNSGVSTGFGMGMVMAGMGGKDDLHLTM